MIIVNRISLAENAEGAETIINIYLFYLANMPFRTSYYY